MLALYASPLCPFAQRCTALLHHLDIKFETREVDLDARDPEFLKESPTGRVPLLIDGKNKLWESRVINDYIATTFGFKTAYSEDPYARAREQLLMTDWDSQVVAIHMRALRNKDSFDRPARKQLVAMLGEFAKTLHLAEWSVINLIGMHCAPFWARMDWMREHSPVPGLIDEFVNIKKWLDSAVSFAPVQRTLPNSEEVVNRYHRVFVSPET